MLERAALGGDGFECYYQDAGEGPPLAMAHGFSANHLSWWQQLPVLGEQYRCLAPDQRRFGLSVDPTDRGVSAFPTDLAALLDAVGVESTALLGHSMGGWTVGSFASQWPERVDALVLSASPGGLLDPDRHRELMAAGEDDLPEFEPPPRPMQFLAGAIQDLNRDAPAEWDDVRPTLDALPLDAETVVDAGIPVLLVTGEADPFMPPPARDAVAERLDAEVVVLADAAHSAYFEQPEAFNAAVLEFLDEHAG